ncbi:hypothetical protein GCM10010207_82960 [Streptomyces atratus]|uniref:hypothetical protein n=1 Tax=Streptomyces atratus TaxID=1893 RepID=UPI0019BE00FD|nr:hypothetical protein [Streptomyces atratus]GGT72355.1 hypothetical protein GCM10010207_82960 [Streptomyces atratus]
MRAAAPPKAADRVRGLRPRGIPAAAGPQEDAAATAHEDAVRRTEATWQEAHDTLAAAERGEFPKVVKDRYSPEVALLSGGERLAGADLLLAGTDWDLSAGLRQRPLQVVAGRSLFVREMELINPPDKPDHCPPGAAWITTLDGSRSGRVSPHHAPGRGLNPHLSPTAPHV